MWTVQPPPRRAACVRLREDSRGPETGREEGAKAEAEATRARTRQLRNIASADCPQEALLVIIFKWAV